MRSWGTAEGPNVLPEALSGKLFCDRGPYVLSGTVSHCLEQRHGASLLFNATPICQRPMTGRWDLVIGLAVPYVTNLASNIKIVYRHFILASGLYRQNLDQHHHLNTCSCGAI